MFFILEFQTTKESYKKNTISYHRTFIIKTIGQIKLGYYNCFCKEKIYQYLDILLNV